MTDEPIGRNHFQKYILCLGGRTLLG